MDHLTMLKMEPIRSEKLPKELPGEKITSLPRPGSSVLYEITLSDDEDASFQKCIPRSSSRNVEKPESEGKVSRRKRTVSSDGRNSRICGASSPVDLTLDSDDEGLSMTPSAAASVKKPSVDRRSASKERPSGKESSMEILNGKTSISVKTSMSVQESEMDVDDGIIHVSPVPECSMPLAHSSPKRLFVDKRSNTEDLPGRSTSRTECENDSHLVASNVVDLTPGESVSDESPRITSQHEPTRSPVPRAESHEPVSASDTSTVTIHPNVSTAVQDVLSTKPTNNLTDLMMHFMQSDDENGEPGEMNMSGSAVASASGTLDRARKTVQKAELHLKRKTRSGGSKTTENQKPNRAVSVRTKLPALETLPLPLEEFLWKNAKKVFASEKGLEEAKKSLESPAYTLNRMLQCEVEFQQGLVNRITVTLRAEMPELFPTELSFRQFHNETVREIMESGTLNTFQQDEIVAGTVMNIEDATEDCARRLEVLDALAEDVRVDQIHKLRDPIATKNREMLDTLRSSTQIMAFADTDAAASSLKVLQNGASNAILFLTNATVTIEGRIFNGVSVELKLRRVF